MTIEDEGVREGFTAIPNALLRNPDIGPGAKVLYGLLLRYTSQGSNDYPGREQLAKEMGSSEVSITRYMKQLSDGGFITIRRRGLGLTNVYTLRPLGGSIRPSHEIAN